MDRQIAFILAGACVALGVGGYLMTESMGEYDLSKSSREHAARVEKLEEGGEKPSLFAALMAKASAKMELARNQYMGQYLPPTPEGWKIEKTHHDDIVDFTVDYDLELALADRSSVRRLTGWGGTNTAKTTDVKYTSGDKVLFFRLVFDKRVRSKPIPAKRAQIFKGAVSDKAEPILVRGIHFDRRVFGEHNLINLYGAVSPNAAIGVFGNGSAAEVEALLASMDLEGFASEGPKSNKSSGGLVVARTPDMETLDAGEDGAAQEKVARRPKPSPKGNLMANLGDDAEEEEVVETEAAAQEATPEPTPRKERKSRNLLSSLLQKAGVSGEADGAGEEAAQTPTIRRQTSEGGGGSSFNRVGNFTSKCETGGGAKICRVGE